MKINRIIFDNRVVKMVSGCLYIVEGKV